MVADPALRESVERVVAAVGMSMVTASSPARKNWLAAAVIITDESGARTCLDHEMPRRDRVVLVSDSQSRSSVWEAAVALGAVDVCVLPAGEETLLAHLAEAAERTAPCGPPGPMIAVVSGRGGAGASVFAGALALSAAAAASGALLVDVDSCSGGLDLLLAAERTAGLRWPDLTLDPGRINWSSLRAALPCVRGVALMSSGRDHHEIDGALISAVIDSGRRGGVTVVCDVPRQLNAAAVCAVENADLVVVITTCDVRSIAATAALTGVVKTLNPNLGLVVRGPSPGGLRAAEAAEVATIPLLAEMRPEPQLAVNLERGGLARNRGTGRRSPLFSAAGKVLRLLEPVASTMRGSHQRPSGCRIT